MLTTWLNVAPPTSAVGRPLGYGRGTVIAAPFGGHEGLLLLYAERLADNPRPAGRCRGRRAVYRDAFRRAGLRGQLRNAPTAGGGTHGDERLETVATLNRTVLDPLKEHFVGRDEVVDLIALAVVAGRAPVPPRPAGHGQVGADPPVRRDRSRELFEYLLTRFSEPNEVFGPIDLARLREGTVATVTTGMLPEAEFVFLDELFNANSAILNNLLTVLNERIYRRGAEIHRLPLLSLFSASNQLARGRGAARRPVRPVPAPLPRR